MSNRFHVTERPGRSAGYCVVCNVASDRVYVFPLGLFILRLCRDCLAQFRQESGEVLDDHDTRILHVAVDRDGWTWRLLQREDGSRCMYYSMPGDPPGSKRIVWDTADTWTDPPRVLRDRAERAEARARVLQ